MACQTLAKVRDPMHAIIFLLRHLVGYIVDVFVDIDTEEVDDSRSGLLDGFICHSDMRGDSLT